MTAGRRSANYRKPARARNKRAAGPRRDRRRETRLQTLGDIATVLGHESRNLFGALKTCLTVLRANSNLSADDRELMDIIEAGARRLGDVMADFAVFSRAAAPRVKEFALQDMLEELFREIRQRRPDLEIISKLSSTVATVRGDRDQLRQALWHILWNGAQAAGTRGKITVEAQSTKRGWQISCADNGPGIAAQDLEKIFEPLYTTKPRSAGLGLAVARRIIEHHRGRLLARSRPGSGARFIVQLPALGALPQPGRKQEG